MHSAQYNDTREMHKDVDVTVVVNYFTLWEHCMLFECLTLNSISQPWTEGVLNGEIHGEPRKSLDKTVRTFPSKLCGWCCLEVPGSATPRNGLLLSHSLSTLKLRLHGPAIP